MAVTIPRPKVVELVTVDLGGKIPWQYHLLECGHDAECMDPRSVTAKRRVCYICASLCEGCGQYTACPGESECEGCEAYRDHLA